MGASISIRNGGSTCKLCPSNCKEKLNNATWGSGKCGSCIKQFAFDWIPYFDINEKEIPPLCLLISIKLPLLTLAHTPYFKEEVRF